MLACLAPWMAVTVACAQTQTNLTVDYTCRGSYVDLGARVDGATYVTPSLFRRIGWAVDVNNGLMNVVGEGRTFELQSKIVNGQRLYPFEQALTYVGGVATWNEADKTLTVLSQVRIIERTSKGLRVDATLTVTPRAFRMTNPDRFVVDFAGATLGEKATEGLPENWKVSQYDPKTVRVLIESPTMATQPVPKLEPSRTVELEIPSLATEAKPVQILAKVGSPKILSETKESLKIYVPLQGTLGQRPSAVFIDPTAVQIAVPGSSAEAVAKIKTETSAFATDVEVMDDQQGTTTVTVKLHRPMAFQLTTDKAGVSIVFAKPNGTGGLTGKVIVVDAGHGGKDTGASHSGVQEKVMSLAMAKEVAQALIKAGASVLMTRSDDTFIPLNERPGLANRSNADLFISCHFNSNSVNESRSGIIMFHHKGDSMDMLLAECLRHEVAKFKAMPDLGVWSDGKIYSSGFAVLRGAQMPAVLMELGFLNHSRDRAKIQTQEFREQVASAVVAGVKEFFGEKQD